MKVFSEINKAGGIAKVTFDKPYTPLRITSKDFKSEGAILLHCTFEHLFSIKDTSVKKGLRFEKCTFEQPAILEKITAEGYDNSISPDSANIVFEDCEFKDSLVIGNISVERDIVLIRCTVKNLIISNSTVTEGSLIVKDCVISGWQFHNNQITLDVRLEKSTFDTQVRWDNIKASTYVFMDSTFKRDVWLWAGEARNGISFNNGVFEDDFTIEAVKSNLHNDPSKSASLTFHSTEFKRNCTVFYTAMHDSTIMGGCPKIYIYSSKFENSLILNGGNSILDKYSIQELMIVASRKLSGQIIINNFTIDRADLNGSNFDASIIFNNVAFQDLALERFSNYGKLQFVDVRSTKENSPRFSILNSNLDNAQFLNSNLKSFDKVMIINSDLSQISSSRVKWFTLDNMEKIYSKEKRSFLLKFRHWLFPPGANEKRFSGVVEEYRKRRELFRQLKYAMEKQGDGIQALTFKEHEMASFKKELQLSRFFWDKDRFIMFLNASNAYGQNWLKAASLAVIFTIIFYGLIMISHSPKLGWTPAGSINEVKTTFDVWVDNWRMIPQLLNPAHILERVFGEKAEISGMTYTLDFAQRIFLSYFIFQTIAAFRKYSK